MADPVVRQAGEARLARLESIRALAALSVLGGHVWATVHGYRDLPTLGSHLTDAGLAMVYLFFALTGYLMTVPFARSRWGGTGHVSLVRYARNRALRILPLYWAVLAVVLVIQRQAGSWHLWWRFATFTENVGHLSADVVDGPMWSLSTEVQFYVLVPILALAARGLTLRRAAGLLALVGLALQWPGSLPGLHHLAHTFNGVRSLPITLRFFVPGMLLALLEVGWARTAWPARLPAACRSAPLWLLGAATAFVIVIADRRPDVALPLGAFLLLGACVLPLDHARVVRLLDVRPLALVGTVSYGLYLVQVPVLARLVRDAPAVAHSVPVLLGVGLLASLAVAVAGYVLVERPFLALRRLWALPPGPGSGSARPVTPHGAVS